VKGKGKGEGNGEGAGSSTDNVPSRSSDDDIKAMQ
jgi:hypothetical protein